MKEFKKNYLTIEEIGNIIEKMNECENSYQREMTKVAMTAQYCLIKEYSEDSTLAEVYNDLAQDGTLEQFDLEISNYYKIDQLMKEESSFYNIVNGLLDIVKKSDSGKVNDLMKMVDKK